MQVSYKLSENLRRLGLLDSRVRGNDEVRGFPVMPAQAGSQKKGFRLPSSNSGRGTGRGAGRMRSAE
jgi:hypothetical protein